MKFFYCEHCQETVETQLVGPGDDWRWDVMCLQCYGTITRIPRGLADALSYLNQHVEAQQNVEVFLESRMVIGSENLPEM